MKPIIPHSTFDDALASARAFLERQPPEAQENLAFVKRLQTDEELNALIALDLRSCHLDHLYYLGCGRSGICLEARTQTGEDIAIMLREFMPIRRAPIPQQLQPLKTFRHGQLSVELLPKLSTKLVSEDKLRILDDAISRQGDARANAYRVTDSATRNAGFGKDNATLFYLDADAINPAKESSTPPLMPPNAWVSENGTWTQYTMYKALHILFDNPLHQHEGKGVPMAALAKAPVDGSKTGPLRL